MNEHGVGAAGQFAHLGSMLEARADLLKKPKG